MTLSSRAGQKWSAIEFDDFIDPALAWFTLEDGDTLTGVPGVSAESEWNNGDVRGSFRAGTDLHLPLDDETSSSAADVSLSNRLQEPVPDLGARASWKWDGLHSLYGEVGIACGVATEENRTGIRSGWWFSVEVMPMQLTDSVPYAMNTIS